MKKLVLLRHGESIWNKENKFTGWTDVDLSEQGIKEAIEAGKILKINNFKFDVAYTSYLKRAIKTLWLALEQMDQMWIPVYKSWRLNEKHYGFLQGKDKSETAKKYGPEKVLQWRRSYDIAPMPIPDDDKNNPIFDEHYKNVDKTELPSTESLKDTIDRITPYWENTILKQLQTSGQILITAHGNSLRGIVKILKNISNEDIIKLNLPTGIPYVFEFDDDLNLIKDYFLGDEDKIKKLMNKVANQAK